MLRNQFVPLRREGNNLHAAMADPTNLERLDELENALNVRIVPYCRDGRVRSMSS